MLLEGPPGVRVDKPLLEDVRRIITELRNLSAATDIDAEVAAFHRVTGLAITQLRDRVTPDVLDQLVQTRRYWEIVTFGSSTRAVIDLIRLEVPDLVDRLTAALEETATELDRWEDAGHVIVPDTNVFLHVLANDVRTPVGTANWHELAEINPPARTTLVLVLTVLDELDRHKRTGNRVQARAVLKELQPWLGGDLPAQLGPGILLDVVVSRRDHVPLPDADYEIIDQASRLESRLPRPIRARIVTADAGMVARARLAGVDVVHIEDRASPVQHQSRRRS